MMDEQVIKDLLKIGKKIKFQYYKIGNKIIENSDYNNDLNYLKYLIDLEEKIINQINDIEDIKNMFDKDYTNEKDIILYHRIINKLGFRLIELNKNDRYNYVITCIQNMIYYDFDNMLLYRLNKSKIKNNLYYLKYDVIFKNCFLEKDFLENKTSKDSYYFQTKLLADKLNATNLYDILIDDYKKTKYESIQIYLFELLLIRDNDNSSIDFYLNLILCCLVYLDYNTISKIYNEIVDNEFLFSECVYEKLLACFKNVYKTKNECFVLSLKNNY